MPSSLMHSILKVSFKVKPSAQMCRLLRVFPAVILPLIRLSGVASIADVSAVLTPWLQYIVLLRYVWQRVAIPLKLWEDCGFTRLGRW